MNDKFNKIRSLVEKELAECSGHDINHVMRVYNICLHIAKGENVDLEILQIAALLHDIGGARETADPTGKTDHAIESVKMAEPILKELNFPTEKIKHIQDCIISHRYKTGNKPKTIEAQILFDADKLDSLGAIGIARAYVWIGKNRANIYKKVNLEEYIKDNLSGKIAGRIQDKTKHSPQIEYETKTKFLVDKLYTKKAKEIGKERTIYYKEFLDRLEREVQGEM